MFENSWVGDGNQGGKDRANKRNRAGKISPARFRLFEWFVCLFLAQFLEESIQKFLALWGQNSARYFGLGMQPTAHRPVPSARVLRSEDQSPQL